MIGLNQYFGWYRWVADFSLLEPYIYELRDLYPRKAIVMTEWGAEGRPELADAPPDLKGGYPVPDDARAADDRRDRPLARAVRRDLLDAARVRDLPRLAGRRGPPRARSTSRTRATTRA